MGVFEDDPRTRRLKADFEAMKRLKESSTIFEFSSTGDPPERYIVTFKGRGSKRKSEDELVEVQDTHRVEIQLAIDYPRSTPYLKWLTDLYHPNIAVSGAVCLGGYSTSWVPSLTLDQLCQMLWDMIRFANYDVESPYNYRAAQWAKTQTQFEFPMDPRQLRDKGTSTQGSNVIKFTMPAPAPGPVPKPAPSSPPPVVTTRPLSPPAPIPSRPAPLPARKAEEDVMFIDGSEPSPAPPRPASPAPAPSRPSQKNEDDILIIE